MKQKSLSQMNKEKKLKPMTIEEEYRNADVPIPNDLLNSSNTENFKDKEVEYNKFLKNFFKGEKK